jgi:hypothetical protein
MYSAIEVGKGTSRPSSIKPSIWKRIASRISYSISATDEAVAMQPGKSGT